MGKYSNKNKKKRNGGGSSNRNNNRNNNPDRRTGPPRVRELRCDKMIAYYTAQGVFGHGLSSASKEEDRHSFLEVSSRTLNATFRLTKLASEEFREEFMEKMNEMIGKEMEIEYQTPSGSKTRKLQPAVPIPYIPNGWKLDVDRSTIRKNASLKKFFEFLQVESDTGRITRQETVSMVPPCALDVHPSHVVLDTCAAPGSKTCQLLETVSMGDGWVAANDVNVSRAHMLVHQCKRINSPHLLVINHLGQDMPMPRPFRNDGKNNEGWADRVLCDVPCTGDGTMRKNAGIFRRWEACQQNNIHKLQLDIAIRGIRQCKVGGLIVYSTCSMSPMENEAVVAQIIRETGGCVEVEECKEMAERGFKCRPGMTEWKVMDDRPATRRHFGEVIVEKPKFDKNKWEEKKDVKMEVNEEGGSNDGEDRPAKKAKIEGEVTKNDGENRPSKRGKLSEDGTYIVPIYDDSPEKWSPASVKADCEKLGLWEFKTYEDVPSYLRASLPKGLFPPTEEEVKTMNLEKCMRIMPQDMDTGGFFVTVLRKTAAIGAVKLKPSPETTTTATSSTAVAVGEDEVVKDEGDKRAPQAKPSAAPNQEFIPLSDDLVESLKDFYGLSGAPIKYYFARTVSAKGIMYVHPPILSHMELDVEKKYKMVHSGVQVFEKNSKNRSLVEYRLHMDGIKYAAPFMTKRKISISRRDYCTIVRAGIEVKENQMRVVMLSDDKTRAVVEELSHGCFVFELEDGNFPTSYLVMWKNNDGTGIHGLVGKIDLAGIHSRMVNEKRWDPAPELKEEWFGRDKKPRRREEEEKEAKVEEAKVDEVKVEETKVEEMKE